MQRTRHASLDFPRSNKRLSPQEEWCEFLSASMAALTTEEDDDIGSRSLNSLPGLELRRSGSVFEPLGVERRDEPSSLGGIGNGKPLRRESFSESLTSSSGSSPAGAAWRPLGRRASAHVVPTSNQLEHHLEYGFDLQPFGQANNSTNGNGAKKLPHTSSFRETLHASSSGSSLVESSSSDEEAAEVIGGTLDNNAFEQPFGVPSLPGLSSLSESGHNLSVDTRSAQVMHVKSPVLSNRKDAQTWQLQDEELLTSPRFGQFRSSLDEAGASVFGGSMGLFPEDNQVLEARETRTRATKDARASSVDFTFNRPADLNPPLPPPQEPQLNRLRARSFSYSAGFGSNNYNPAFVNKQYVPPPQPDFPVTMRQFHAGAPPPPQPTSLLQQGVIRPPRVSIPSNDVQAYNQHQGAQPPPYRRYSTDFAAPPYPDHMMPHEPEVNPHRTPTGRGMRSYSMEYFQSNQRVRTHSLEGNQMFAPAAPPVEYPVVGRHASGAVTYEWPRSPLGAPPAPPLPPDSRVGNSSNNQYPPPPPDAYYEVEFKRGRTELFAGNAGYNPGEYVKVEADRGEDIGRIARRITDISKLSSSSSADPSSHTDDAMGRPKRHELPAKKIISVANARECELLSEQRKEEHEVFEVCKSKVRQRLLPMNVIDAEYQFDRHKLTFFFEADRRIDFRELVRDLFAIYKTRIWLQQVVPSGKKSLNEMEMMN